MIKLLEIKFIVRSLNLCLLTCFIALQLSACNEPKIVDVQTINIDGLWQGKVNGQENIIEIHQTDTALKGRISTVPSQNKKPVRTSLDGSISGNSVIISLKISGAEYMRLEGEISEDKQRIFGDVINNQKTNLKNPNGKFDLIKK